MSYKLRTANPSLPLCSNEGQIEGAGYVDFSYSFITKSANLRNMTIEDFANFLNRYTPNSNYSPNDALQIFQLIYNTTNP